VAYELKVPVSTVSVKPTNTTINANNFTTGGSITTEACAAVSIVIDYSIGVCHYIAR